ncbi:MAG: cysteine desulfurase family protein [Desulfonatronovibrionaceae bacterium]
MKSLYFDYNATTPVHELVVRAMLPYFTEKFGNPGSVHPLGLEARNALDQARSQLAGLINCSPEQIIFTSCATESNNMVLRQVLKPGRELIISAVEHPAVAQPSAELAEAGILVQTVPVDRQGFIQPEKIMDLVSPRTGLISVMLANNETGAVQPVKSLKRLIKPGNILIHTDAAQAVGKIPVDVQELGVDFLTIAGHKMYAPKGIGALFVRDPSAIKPMFSGGGQEKGIRPGTENIPYAVALGRAALLADDIDREAPRQQELGKKLLEGLNRINRHYVLHSQSGPRLPNTMSIGFWGYQAGDILSAMIALHISASAGAACHGTVREMSSVLKAMQVNPKYGLGTIRFSWGRMTTLEDIHELLNRLEYIFQKYLA